MIDYNKSVTIIIVVEFFDQWIDYPINCASLSINSRYHGSSAARVLDGLVVSTLDFQAGYREFESCSGRDNFQTISTPSS